MAELNPTALPWRSGHHRRAGSPDRGVCPSGSSAVPPLPSYSRTGQTTRTVSSATMPPWRLPGGWLAAEGTSAKCFHRGPESNHRVDQTHGEAKQDRGDRAGGLEVLRVPRFERIAGTGQIAPTSDCRPDQVRARHSRCQRSKSCKIYKPSPDLHGNSRHNLLTRQSRNRS